jgi:hypothetical protein
MSSLDDVYRKFGEASEAAQLLETELGTILLEIHAVESDLLSGERRDEAADILTRINKSTLGQMLKAIGEKTPSLEHAAALFAEALAERNRLSHSFFRRHNFRRNSPEGCATMLADLESIHRTLLEAYKVALAVSGIDLDSVRLPDLPKRHLRLD